MEISFDQEIVETSSEDKFCRQDSLLKFEPKKSE